MRGSNDSLCLRTMTGCLCLLLTAQGCGLDRQADSQSQIEAKYDRAIELSQARDYEQAIEVWTELIELEPENPSHYGNRANCYSYLGKLELALKDYERSIAGTIALSGNPDDPKLAYIYYNRGYAYDKQGQAAKALVDYERTLKVAPEYPDVRNNMAWIMATSRDEKLRDSKRAVKLAAEECQRTNWESASVIDTYAAALAADGQFQQAVEKQQQALDQLETPELEAGMQKRLKLYESKQVFIDDDEE